MARKGTGREGIGGRRLIAAAAFVLFTALVPAAAQAALGTGAATQFLITVNAVALCTNATCTQKAELGRGTKTFDIASVAVGSAVGSFSQVNNLVKNVTYTHVQVEIGRSYTLTGSVAFGADTCFTDASAPSGSTTIPSRGKHNSAPATPQTLFLPDAGAFGGNPTQAAYDAAGVALLGPATAAAVLPLTQPFTAVDKAPTISVAFNTQSALGAFFTAPSTCFMFVEAPSVTISITTP
ncbi:MAG: hypothetical protein O2807_01975 [bacterium]|nr:hypothetical protein [bacterium]